MDQDKINLLEALSFLYESELFDVLSKDLGV